MKLLSPRAAAATAPGQYPFSILGLGAWIGSRVTHQLIRPFLLKKTPSHTTCNTSCSPIPFASLPIPWPENQHTINSHRRHRRPGALCRPPQAHRRGRRPRIEQRRHLLQERPGGICPGAAFDFLRCVSCKVCSVLGDGMVVDEGYGLRFLPHTQGRPFVLKKRPTPQMSTNNSQYRLQYRAARAALHRPLPHCHLPRHWRVHGEVCGDVGVQWGGGGGGEGGGECLNLRCVCVFCMMAAYLMAMDQVKEYECKSEDRV